MAPKVLDGTLTPTQQLGIAKEITKQVGALHEAQHVQVSLWPYAVDPALPILGGSRAELDMEKFVFRYYWKHPDRAPAWRPDVKYAERLGRLHEGVRTMLGNAWRLEVYMNGETPDARIYPGDGIPKRKRRPRKKGRTKRRR